VKVIRAPADLAMNEEAIRVLAQLQSVYDQAAEVLGEEIAKSVWIRAMIGTEKNALYQSLINSQTLLSVIGKRQRNKVRKTKTAPLNILSPTTTRKAKEDLKKMVTIPGLPSAVIIPETNCRVTTTQIGKFGKILRIAGQSKEEVDETVRKIHGPKWWAMLKLNSPYVSEANWKKVIPRKFIYRVVSQTAKTSDEIGELLFASFGLRTSWIQQQDTNMFVVVIPFPESALKVIGQSKNGIGLLHYDIVKQVASVIEDTPKETPTMAVISPLSPRLAWISADDEPSKVKQLLFGDKKAITTHGDTLSVHSSVKHLHSPNRGIGKRANWR